MSNFSISGTLKIAGKDGVSVEESGTGYVKYSDGTMFCYGFDNNALSGYMKTITLPKPYKDTNYSVVVTPTAQGSDTYSFYAKVDTTSAFTVRNRSNAQGIMWQTIGKWK
uniref:Putative tail fiber protein n=1 Tax=virus sp. cti5L29 TaxID=2826813 RepID=A0A8S5R8W9_9VIRU|nr:MAG TPA: putative tail fiber protein [virus sp. cti5L29]